MDHCLSFNRFRVPGLVQLDSFRNSELFGGMYAPGAPMQYFTETKPIFGRSLTNPIGKLHFRKCTPTNMSIRFDVHRISLMSMVLGLIQMGIKSIFSNKVQVYERLESAAIPNTHFKVLWLVFLNPQKSTGVGCVGGCLS